MVGKLARLRPKMKKSLVREVELSRTIARHDPRRPPVISTPSMIGQMEQTAGTLLLPFLPRGALWVGTHINVSHRAPAALGEKLRTTAVLERISPPKKPRRHPRYLFSVEAKVGRRLVGAGTVEVAVVDHAGFAARAKPQR